MLLDSHELVRWIPLEADEEEPGIEFTSIWIDAVREAVTASENGNSVIGRRSGYSDVSGGRYEGSSVAVQCRQIDRVVFVGRAERGATRLDPTDGAFLIAEGASVPRFEVDPDPACHQVRATSHPMLVRRVANPDRLVHGSCVRRDEVVRAVLEAEQIAGGYRRSAARRCPTEPELEVSEHDGSEP